MAIKDYVNLEPFRYWCQTVLPTVYDESLSYYELLNKVVNYLNDTMKDVTVLHGEVVSYTEQFNQLRTFVNTYFDNLDVQAEINNKLNEMAESGELTRLFQSIVITTVTNSADAWLDKNITPTAPALDATLTLANAAAQAKAVGDMLYGGTQREGLTPKVMVGFSTYGYSSENPFGILDIPIYSYAAFANARAFSDAPPDLPETGRYCVYRIPSASVQDRSLVILFDQNHEKLYLNTVLRESGETSIGTWKSITVPLDSTLTLADAAAQSKAVGDILYGGETREGLTPRTLVQMSTYGYSSENPFGILDIPWCGYAALTNLAAFSDAPAELPKVNGRYCVYRIPSASIHDRSLVILFDQNNENLYLNTVFKESGVTTIGSWKKITSYQHDLTSTIGVLKQIAFSSEAGKAYYRTILEQSLLEEVDTTGSWRIGYVIRPDGTILSNAYTAVTMENDTFFPSGEGVTYHYGGSKWGRTPGRVFLFLHEYDSNGVWLRRTNFMNDKVKIIPVTTGENCAKVRFSFGYNSLSEIRMTQNDIDKFAVFYKEVSE